MLLFRNCFAQFVENFEIQLLGMFDGFLESTALGMAARKGGEISKGSLVMTLDRQGAHAAGDFHKAGALYQIE